MYDTMIVGAEFSESAVDLTASSKAALQTAPWFASDPCRMVVHHIIAPEIPADLRAYTGLSEQAMRHQLVEQARQRLVDWAKGISVPGVIDIEAEVGDPRSALVEKAARVGADLLVLGSPSANVDAIHTHLAIRHMIAEAPCSLALIREDGATKLSQCIVATDAHGDLGTMVGWAARLLQRGCRVDLVHACTRPWFAPHYGIEIPGDGHSQKAELARENIEALLHQAGLSPDDEKLRVVIRENARPIRTLCDWAQETEADLVVVGARRGALLKHAVMGTTAEHIQMHSNAHVLVVRPEE